LRWREGATAASDIGGKSPASFLSLSLKSITTLESDHLLHLSITISVVYCAALTQRKRRSEELQGVSRALAWTLMSVTYLRKAFPRRFSNHRSEFLTILLVFFSASGICCPYLFSFLRIFRHKFCTRVTKNESHPGKSLKTVSNFLSSQFQQRIVQWHFLPGASS
jgi:hypothetical protein